jgi:hypothetical protein
MLKSKHKTRINLKIMENKFVASEGRDFKFNFSDQL